MKTYNILLLGAGVQSSVILLMMERGDLPRADLAIFADTGWEPPDVYSHLEWLKSITSIPTATVRQGNIKEDSLRARPRNYDSKNNERWASLPYFTKNANGKVGMLRRQCTKEYKIMPIERYIRRDLLGLKPKMRIPKGTQIQQWYGITADEAQRMRGNNNPRIENVYPFCLQGDKALKVIWTRQDCIDWLAENYPKRIVPKSACVCCPFRDNYRWREIRDTMPNTWDELIEFDSLIRNRDHKFGECYLHRSCKAISDIDLRTETEKGQQWLWGNECEGMCGV